MPYVIMPFLGPALSSSDQYSLLASEIQRRFPQGMTVATAEEGGIPLPLSSRRESPSHDMEGDGRAEASPSHARYSSPGRRAAEQSQSAASPAAPPPADSREIHPAPAAAIYKPDIASDVHKGEGSAANHAKPSNRPSGKGPTGKGTQPPSGPKFKPANRPGAPQSINAAKQRTVFRGSAHVPASRPGPKFPQRPPAGRAAQGPTTEASSPTSARSLASGPAIAGMRTSSSGIVNGAALLSMKLKRPLQGGDREHRPPVSAATSHLQVPTTLSAVVQSSASTMVCSPSRPLKEIEPLPASAVPHSATAEGTDVLGGHKPSIPSGSLPSSEDAGSPSGHHLHIPISKLVSGSDNRRTAAPSSRDAPTLANAGGALNTHLQPGAPAFLQQILRDIARLDDQVKGLLEIALKSSLPPRPQTTPRATADHLPQPSSTTDVVIGDGTSLPDDPDPKLRTSTLETKGSTRHVVEGAASEASCQTDKDGKAEEDASPTAPRDPDIRLERPWKRLRVDDRGAEPICGPEVPANTVAHFNQALQLLLQSQGYVRHMAIQFLPVASDLLNTRQQLSATTSKLEDAKNQSQRLQSHAKQLEQVIASSNYQITNLTTALNQKQRDNQKLHDEFQVIQARATQHSSNANNISSAVRRLLGVVNASTSLTDKDKLELTTIGVDLLQCT